MYDFNPKWRNDKYYFFPGDIENCPEADIYVVWSRRGPGKTYSALRWAYEQHIQMIYVKRTNKDVHALCNSKGGLDMSPYVPINRDAGYNIKAAEIDEGVGAFYDHVDEDGRPYGAPFSYCVSLNAIKTLKGFDLSSADWLLLDEFIPLPGEKVLQAEGEQLLSVYMTIARDRVKRGRPPLKLIMFANAENISTPITRELEIVDDMVNVQASKQNKLYIEDRGIYLHHITEEEIPISNEEINTGLARAMRNTSWFEKAFSGLFSGNDFTKIRKVPLKGYKPRAMYRYKNSDVYIYQKGAEFYLTYSKTNRLNEPSRYLLVQESEQKRFFYDVLPDLKLAEIDGKVAYESYTMYDLITRYKTYFRI